MVYTKMIARAVKGKEYMYSRSSAHAVSAAGAGPICAALNAAGWGLGPGEVWHVYDLGWYEREATAAGLQAFTRRGGRIQEKRL